MASSFAAFVCRVCVPHRAQTLNGSQTPRYAHKQKGSPLKWTPFLEWSGKRDSNSRPQPWQGCALPTELFPHCHFHCSGLVNPNSQTSGGAVRSRTGLTGFAIRGITALLSRRRQGPLKPLPTYLQKREAALPFFKTGAGNETRTRDLNLGKVALYQLSYSRIYSTFGVFVEVSNYSPKNQALQEQRKNFRFSVLHRIHATRRRADGGSCHLRRHLLFCQGHRLAFQCNGEHLVDPFHRHDLKA